MIFENEAEFEDNLIEVLIRHGWKDGVFHYPTEEALLENWKNILFQNNQGRDRLNNYPLTKGEMSQIIEQIESLATPLALNSFINGRTISITRDNPEDKEHLGKEVSLKIYDRNEIAAGDSVYQIAQQPIFPAKDKILNDRRGDLCLLINGMPVIHIELKRSGIPISQAENQIKKYSAEGVFAGLFSLVQIFVAMNPDDAVYYANPGTGNLNPSFYFHWADFNNEPICANKNPGKDEWKKFTSELLSIPMAHRLIGFYTVADGSDGFLKVLRSYQYYAVNAISDTVRKCDWEKRSATPGKLGGYIWHTTGSGKTMTSFKSAQLIADSKDADKVVFLMDRIELGTQSLKEYQSFADDADDVQGTENTQALLKTLLSTEPKDTLIVTSIQKMSNIKAGQHSVTKNVLSNLTSKRIVFIIDECHRSTFGEMLQDIRHSFPQAIYFGFTGTPIFDENQKRGSTTSSVFGPCLHRYSIADGIRDHNVLGFDPSKVLTFSDSDLRLAVALREAQADDIEDALNDPQKAKIYYHYMNKAEVPMGPKSPDNTLNDDCIEAHIKNEQYGVGTPHEDAVIADIIDQFPRLSSGNKFHAIFATSSIPEAISYYRKLKEQAPTLHVTALFDPNIDNSDGAITKEQALYEIIQDYNVLFNKDFTIATWPAMKRDIASRLSHKRPYGMIDSKRDLRIDILIVVDQMLTGFDSKWVNTLFMDKIINYENIIQAFSRTNRLFGDEKPFGTIRYYRKPHTMKAKIGGAVKLYSGDRPLDLFVQKLPDNIKLMNEHYQTISIVFASSGIDNFITLPDLEADKKKFAKEFVEFNSSLEAAKVQGFSWSQHEYVFKHSDGSEITIIPELDETIYLILLQRYKELFTEVPTDNPGWVPYALNTHLTEIDTGLIDDEYMNSNFVKWLKALNSNDPTIEAITEELHRSFAALSKEDQRLAEMFLHDIESGDVFIDETRTLRDYITSYAKKEKDDQIDHLVSFLGVDRELLEDFLRRDVNETNLDEFGKFGELKATVDEKRAKESFEALEGKPISRFKVNMKVNALLTRFILQGGFNIEEYSEKKS